MDEWTDIGNSRVALGILPFVSVSESLYYLSNYSWHDLEWDNPKYS